MLGGEWRTVERLAKFLSLIALLVIAPLVSAQIQVGENTTLNASGLVTGGYAGDYGNTINSSHGLEVGINGSLNGDYFNPNFLNFVITPYYNQSRNDSSYQSLTGASGVAATANIFTGSHFPGAVSYHYDYNSTGTNGLIGTPNFTTTGTGQGFSVNWSALFNGWPTLSVGYSQGSGDSTVYGTDQESSGHNKNFNVHSGYTLAGWRLNAYYDRHSFESVFPEFLAGMEEDVSNSTANDIGVNGQHRLPLHGSFAASYTWSSASSDFLTDTGSQQEGLPSSTSYTTQNENATASFHPTQKFGFSLNESFTDDLSGYINQAIINSGGQPINVNLGSGSKSLTFNGGASYQISQSLNASLTMNHYQQYYLGQNYNGNYLSGTLNYGKKILNTFTFSAGIVDSSTGHGDNALGFIGNVNFFRRFGGWETSGFLSYAQNVQTLLITYTTSSYNYSARLRHRLPWKVMWIASFNGSHSGFSQQQDTTNHSEAYSTSLSTRRFSLSGYYTSGYGNSYLGSAGLVPLPPTPGIPESELIIYNSSAYGGSISSTPVRRLTISGSYARGISNTIGGTDSHNNTEIFNSQLQYRLRRISLLAGWTRFTQGISAVNTGTVPTTSSYFVGISRWFNIF